MSSKPLILAPLQGLTEVLYRRTYEQCFPGAFDGAVAPFISLTHGNLADAWKKIGDVLPDNNRGSIPVTPQILGKEPDEFIALANRMGEVLSKDRGCTTEQVEVNWNIGCPMRKVAGKHRGSGILPYPDEVRRVLDAVVPQLQVGLSIKMRLGHNSPDEIFNLIPILNDYPLVGVTIHPRTGKQQYGGSVDIERFAQAYGLLKAPVTYNGDICSVADYRRIVGRFPNIRAVMIGRGVLYDPLLPWKIKENIHDDPQKAIVFLESLIENILARPLSDEGKMRKIKEYWCLCWHSLPITEQQSRELLHQPSLQLTVENFHHLK